MYVALVALAQMGKRALTTELIATNPTAESRDVTMYERRKQVRNSAARPALYSIPKANSGTIYVGTHKSFW